MFYLIIKLHNVYIIYICKPDLLNKTNLHITILFYINIANNKSLYIIYVYCIVK